MSTAQQIVQLKRLALKTSQHLPHNDKFAKALIGYKLFKATNPNTTSSQIGLYQYEYYENRLINELERLQT